MFSSRIGIDAERLAAVGPVGQNVLCRSPWFRGFASGGHYERPIIPRLERYIAWPVVFSEMTVVVDLASPFGVSDE